MTRGQTPSQTVGPFFALGMIREPQNVLVTAATEGERIRIEGTFFDGAGTPIDDGVIEIWQADAKGRYDRAPFAGFGRAATSSDGSYLFETIRPGAAAAAGSQAAHVNVAVFARGMLLHAFTRMYFSDDEHLGDDSLLTKIDPLRRATLVGQRVERDGHVVYRWDIHLQGERETVFLDA